MAIPHKDCARIAPADFLSDETKTAGKPLWLAENFCKIGREICKQDGYKAVRRSLCGIALCLQIPERAAQKDPPTKSSRPARAYSFTAPLITPLTKYFWINGYMKIIGPMVMMVTAIFTVSAGS